jgi:hypothetical protein
MPIKNYTSDVLARRTVAEIQEMLSEHGSTDISVRYKDREPVAVWFVIPTKAGDQSFLIPANVGGVRLTMQQQAQRGQIRNYLVTQEQATRTAWRIVRDWIAAQLAMVEAGMAEPTEVFLAWAQLPGRETTVWEEQQARGMLALPPAREQAQ